jgi:hypothetical protein
MLHGLTSREALVATLGGLLTAPEFVELTPALGVATERVLALDDAASADRASGAVANLVGGIEVELQSPDHMPNPFTDLLVTPLGAATVRCDYSDDSVRNAELLIDAALGASHAQEDNGSATLASVLGLMQELARRCEWRLYGLFSDETPGSPDNERLDQLAARVLFHGDTLSLICGDKWLSSLDPLLYNGVPERARERPLVRTASGGVVVARPEALAGALAFALAELACVSDGGAGLDDALSLLAADRALTNIAELGGRHTRAAPDVDSAFAHASSLVLLDTDVLLHLVVLTVDLTGGVPPPGSYWHPPFGASIPAHLEAVERRIRGEADHVETVIHLVVLEGAGAQPFLSLDRPADVESSHLIFTASELEWLARHEDLTTRDLAAFAYDLADLRSRINYLTSTDLDTFQVWRTEPFSLMPLEGIARDNEFPDVMLGAGSAVDLRLEVLDRFEPTVAPSPDGSGAWRIARFLEYRDVELWRPWGGPDWPPHFFVPGIGPGIWVLDDSDRDLPSEPVWDVRRKHTELVAYWLWRLSDQLVALRAALEGQTAPLVVRMNFESPDVETGVHPGPRAFDVATTDDAVRVTVRPTALQELGGPDAEPEHAYIRRVLAAVAALAGVPEIGVVEFPQGLRKLIFLRTGNPAVELVKLPSGVVHPSYRARPHRAAGRALLADKYMSVGLVHEEDRANLVLHRAVGILQTDLERQLERLDAHSSRLLLLGTYERLLHDRAVGDLELSAIDEFFGHDSEAAQRRLDQFRSLSEASVACRYVIEVAAAKPPKGSALISDHAMQNLLATARSIIHFGRVSDLVHFRLTREASVALVPPDLLMAGAADHFAASKQFATAVREGDIERSASQRETLIRGRESSSAYDERSERIRQAHLQDHGCTLDDVGMALSGLVQVAFPPFRVAELSRSDLNAVIGEALECPERTAAVIELLTLEPRPSFTKPPPPYTFEDVAPWRFNRGLSYLRRPLVRTVDTGGSERYLFGPGACYGAAEWLDELARTARLGTEGSALRAATIALQQELSRKFEEEVSDAFSAVGGWNVLTRVKKIGNERLRRPNGDDLGDVDSLAINPASKLIICCEAKSLAGALAPHQLRNELDANFGIKGSRPSAAEKTQERRACIETRIQALLHDVGINDTSAGWKVRACMVTDYENLSALITECPVPVLTLRVLRSSLEDGSVEVRLGLGGTDESVGRQGDSRPV